MSPFLSRILVAAALLPLVLGIVWLGGWWLCGLVLGGVLVALHELYVMTRGLRPLALAGFAGGIATVVGAQLGGPTWLLGGMMLTFVVAFVLFGLSDARPSFTGAMATTVLGVVWVAGGLGLLMLVRDIPEHGRLAVFTVLIAVFADDTFAYFVGRAVGRHKMAPTISPGKSWEGFVGGTAAAVAVTFFGVYEEGFLDIWESIVLGAAIAVAAVMGDVFESAVKRDVGVKDSGRLLAGHGGVLDRVDSLLFAGPAAYFVVLAFG